MPKKRSALTMAHETIAQFVKPGAFCIDATAGRGNDTLYLATLSGHSGKVIAFDIQQEAVDSTNALLAAHGFSGSAKAVLCSHTEMGRYASAETVDCITFNFGWLPGADHSVFTKAQSSVQAVQQGLALLKQDGLMTLCIYYGRDNGLSERDALLEYVRGIDSKQYTVIEHHFSNRPNNPPIYIMIVKAG